MIDLKLHINEKGEGYYLASDVDRATVAVYEFVKIARLIHDRRSHPEDPLRTPESWTNQFNEALSRLGVRQ